MLRNYIMPAVVAYNYSMDNYEKNFLSQRPQELCLMCGKCCKVATTSIPYEEMKQMADQGNKGAIDFLDTFEPFANIEEARKIAPDIVDNILERFKEDNRPTDNMTFYTCKYLREDNLCGRYEERKALCKHFPASPWAIVPPGCGFEGWLFLKREEIKQKIRKVKEELIELELLKTKVKDEETLTKIKNVEEKMHKSIDTYKKYGSEDW